MARTRDHLLKLAALMLAACSGEDNSSSGQQAMVAPPLPPAVAVPRAPFFAPPFAYDDQYTQESMKDNDHPKSLVNQQILGVTNLEIKASGD
jgi:hypothetical protein